MGGGQFWDPAVAPRLAAGWQAIQAHLVAHERAGWVALKEAARKNSDLKGETCRNLVRQAAKAGLIVKDGRGYRLTAEGLAAGPPKGDR